MPKNEKMSANSKRLLIWLILASVLVFALFALFWPRSAAVDLGTLSPGPLVVTVDEEGKTRVRDSFVLSAPVSGRLSRIEANVGDFVTANDTVIAEIEPIDPALLDARSMEQARADIKSAESAEALAKANLARGQAELEFVESELERSRQLRNDRMISVRDLDVAVRNAKTARAAVETLAAALQVSRHDLERARAQLMTPTESASLRQECTCVPVMSSTDGQILQVLRESEGIVAAGEPLVEIGDVEDLEIVVDLLSTDAIKVQPGQRVIIRGWGGDGELEGVVRRVEPFARTKVSALGIEEQRVNVIIDLSNPPQMGTGLGHGFQVEISIVLWEADDVLTVPLTALFRSGDAWALYVEHDGRAVMREVALGRKTQLRAQITDGLQAGERIVLYPSDRIVDNTRITQRQTS